MRFQPRFLVITLFALCVCLSAGGQQQTPTVNLRPSATVSDPNVPSVRVTVDQQRVPLGTLVTFSMSPAGVAGDRRYVVTLYFGDGRQQVMRQATTTHLYQAVGNYTYSVSVKAAAGDPPRVDLSASPSPARPGQAIAFVAQPSGPYPNLQYRFNYGDGTQSNWQTSATVEHAYARPGNYSAYVDIGNATQRIGGSARKQITVTSVPLSVSLRATPLPAQAKRPVIFNATVSPNVVNATYQFSFGDGEPPVVQTSPQVQHVYKNSGSYRAFVKVSQSGSPASAGQSNPIVLNIQPVSTTAPTASGTPTSRATPSPPPSGTPAQTPSTSPAGSPSPGSPSSTPEGSPPSTSPPTASDSSSPNVAGPVVSTSPSGPSPSLDNRNQTNSGLASIRWWHWLLAALLLLSVFKASGYLFTAKPTFAAFSDPGVATAGNRKSLPLDFQLVLNPNISAGDYSVMSEAPQLITDRNRLGDRQVLEI